MKHTKKLIPAIGMLLLSACMLVTSTFAWFSMNDNVTVTDMTVTAKGDQVYLQIVAGKDANQFVNGDDQITAKATNTTAELLPTNIKTDDSTWGDYNGGNTFVWAKATGTAPDVSDKTGVYSQATNTDDTKYYLENSFMVRLDPTAGAANASGALRVSGVNFADGENVDALGQTVCVFVVCGTNSQLYTYNGTSFERAAKSNEYLDGTNIDGTPLFANTAGVQVDVYVFFNGDHDNCTLENLAQAKADGYNNYAVEVTFTVAA